MDKFKTVLNIANRQSTLSKALVALLTAGGEQIFSAVAFACPCSRLNFVYGLVFLLVPALVLLVLGFLLSKKTWKLLTGLCRRRRNQSRCRCLAAACTVLVQVGAAALVAPSSWIAVALLNGKYYECAMSGTNMSLFNQYVCGDQDPDQGRDRCLAELHGFPCNRAGEQVMLQLRAQSQILGWLLIAAIVASNLLLTCMARCSSPVSYLQLRFWSAYAQEENRQLDACSRQHAAELAERNVRSFFQRAPPDEVATPSKQDWEKISALFRFSGGEHYYSTLHRCVENLQPGDGGVMRVASIKSAPSAEDPAVLQFVDDGRISLDSL
ncbi:unnamed protein product [Ophioblennius macclurei]